MTDSLRDQLLGLGFPAPSRNKTPIKPPGDRRRNRAGKPPDQGRPANRTAKSGSASPEEIDLARAYALRRSEEKREAARLAREKAAEKASKAAAKAEVDRLLEGQARNLKDDAASLARHFEFQDKIRRVHVDAAQLKALNAGELAIVQHRGRFLLVDNAVADAVAAIFPSVIALRVDQYVAAPADVASGEPDLANDPRFAVPDDLIW